MISKTSGSNASPLQTGCPDQGDLDRAGRSGLHVVWHAVRVNRYDGYKFKVFKHDPGRPDSLSGVYVHACSRTGPARFGSQTIEFLDRFDPTTETFTHYRLDSRGSEGASVRRHPHKRGSRRHVVGGNRRRSAQIGSATGRITGYRHDPDDPSSLSSNSSDRAAKISEAPSGLPPARAWTFDRDAGKVTLHVPLPEPSILVPEDSSGIFWIIYATGNGLAVFDRETNRLTRYSFHEREPASTARTVSATMIEDKAGNLWLGTAGEGVLKFDRERRRFIRYRNHPAIPIAWLTIM